MTRYGRTLDGKTVKFEDVPSEINTIVFCNQVFIKNGRSVFMEVEAHQVKRMTNAKEI